jgi:hypothetical protein
VLKAWLAHPEFPTLIATCFGKGLRQLPSDLREQARQAQNIELWEKPVERSQIEVWLATVPIHLCPSCAEGFGHTLNESRFRGALIVTTAGEPMSYYANLAIPARPRGLFHYVEAEGVAATIEQALRLQAYQREELGRANQIRFLADHRSFMQSFANLAGF